MVTPASLPDSHLLQALWENAPNGLILYQIVHNDQNQPIDFLYSWVNPVAAALLRARAEDIVGQSCQVIFPQGDALRDHYRQVALTKQNVQVDYELPTDGRWVEVLITYQHPDILLCFFSDITARRRSQLNLQEENRRLNEAQAIGKVGSFEWKLGDSIVNWSDELYRIHGLEPQAIPILIEEADNFFHPEDRSAIASLQQQSFRCPGYYGLIHRSQREDGRELWVNHQFESIADQVGQVVRVHGTVQDITEYRQVQQQLALTAQNLQVVLDASPASIAYLKASRDSLGQVQDLFVSVCNQTFAQESSRSISSLTGTSIRELAAGLWGEHSWANLLQVLVTGQPYYTEQQQATGRWIGLAVSKHVDGVVVTGLDITALKQAQEQYQQGLAALQASQLDVQTLVKLHDSLRQRGELLRTSSHDLRGNIGIIAGATSLLALATSKTERTKVLTMLQRNVQQATQLLNQLLDYGRLEAGQEVRRLASFDVASLLGELLTSVEPLVQERGLWLEKQGPDELAVVGDALQVGRMAQNLLLNAIHYTQAGGIRLKWGIESIDRWWFSVEDTGPGLPTDSEAAQHQAGAHSPATHEGFPTIESMGKSFTGEGIGLRIVRQLGELLEAHISVESRVGVGTRFVVSLPRQYNH